SRAAARARGFLRGLKSVSRPRLSSPLLHVLKSVSQPCRSSPLLLSHFLKIPPFPDTSPLFLFVLLTVPPLPPPPSFFSS
ncbi:hypothetical protein PDJAM_G00149790, partial [Pangasius djambal]|nr:hypothetical protein [Pangasius djambal]